MSQMQKRHWCYGTA